MYSESIELMVTIHMIRKPFWTDGPGSKTQSKKQRVETSTLLRMT